MDEFDDKLGRALRADANGLTSDESIESIRRMLAETFRMRARSFLALVWIKLLAHAAIAIFLAVMFFRADTTKEQVGYATGFAVAYLGMVLIWAIYWMVLNRNATLRELKRLELRIAELAARVD